jgi:hypothetical protein
VPKHTLSRSLNLFQRIHAEKRREKRSRNHHRRGCLDLLGREAGHTIDSVDDA